MRFETETIDKLFLELSQITKAETSKEIALNKKLLNAMHALIDCKNFIKNCDKNQNASHLLNEIDKTLLELSQ